IGDLHRVYRGGWKRRVEGGCGAGTKPHHHRHQYAELERHRNDKATPKGTPSTASSNNGNHGVWKWSREGSPGGGGWEWVPNRSATKPIQSSALIVEIRDLLAQSPTPRGDS